jgi:hypothetical protein
LTIASTFNASDPLAWRQWHHWSIAPGIAKVRLPAGKSVLNAGVAASAAANNKTKIFFISAPVIPP